MRLSRSQLIGVYGTICVAVYLLDYIRHPQCPNQGTSIGWFVSFDQDKYYKASLAWSRGDLSPDAHWYMPGYPILAAPLIKLLSYHAYAVVDLVCLLLSLALFIALSSRLLPTSKLAPSLGAIVFVATTLLWPGSANIWVIPWSTTATTPLILACLLAAVSFIERRSARAAAVAAFCGTFVFAFRPTDVLPTVAGPALCMSLALFAGGEKRGRQALTCILTALGGAGLAALLTAALYVPEFGWKTSAYLRLSARIGLDAGLIPLHWVTLFIDPKPVYQDGQGLIAVFPWLATGFCGLIVASLCARSRDDALSHTAVLVTTAVYITIYLAYRDLNPPGLFRYQNYHYFKWIFPLAGVYTLILMHRLCTQRRAIAVAAIAALCLLPWRVKLVDVRRLDGHVTSTNTIFFQANLSSVDDGVIFRGTGDWWQIYYGGSTLVNSRGVFVPVYDYRLTPRFDGYMLMMMRPAGSGSMRLHLPPGIRMEDALPVAVHQHISFGLPCWFDQCEPERVLPPA